MKVRIKELAQEAKFIRFEEIKCKKYKEFLYEKYPSMDDEIGLQYRYVITDLHDLTSHRRHTVREAARAVQLAYAFLRGIPYSNVESKRKPEKEYRFKHYILPEIIRIANKFGNLYSWKKETYEDDIKKWLDID